MCSAAMAGGTNSRADENACIELGFYPEMLM
jgi:hypothetical protein